MKTSLDCIPCFYRQILAAARLAGADERQTKKALDGFSKTIPGLSLEMSPAEIGRYAYKNVCRVMKNSDPYLREKEQSTRAALRIYPFMKKSVSNSADSLRRAVELAIMGNIIDYGVAAKLDLEGELKKIMKSVGIASSGKRYFQYEKFRKKLKKARRMLYLADNAGETVFDRVLMEEILKRYPGIKIIYAVKGKPVINDAVMKDASDAGVDKIVRVVSCGSDAPGTVLSLCTKKFLKIFKDADLIISKGQGNFEALGGGDGRIFYMFRVKCEVVGKHTGLKLGTTVLWEGRG